MRKSTAKSPGGRPPHEPTKATRDTVRLHAIVGTRHEMIAQVLQVDVKTLYKYYRRELDTARDLANAQVGGALFNKALAGDTTAQIFWMKTRARWKEEQIIEHTGPGGSALTPTVIQLVGPADDDSQA